MHNSTGSWSTHHDEHDEVNFFSFFDFFMKLSKLLFNTILKSMLADMDSRFGSDMKQRLAGMKPDFPKNSAFNIFYIYIAQLNYKKLMNDI